MKVVINTTIGGFSLSIEATRLAYERGMKDLAFKDEVKKEDLDRWRKYTKSGEIHSCLPLSDDLKFMLNDRTEDRSNPILIQIIEEMGEKANGLHAILKIVDIPDDIEYNVCEADDGREWIAEKHRIWE